MTLGKVAVFLILSVLVTCLPGHVQQPSSMGASFTPLRPVLTSPITSVVGTNIPVVGEAAPDRQQVETSIAVDPRNPNILVAGAQDLKLKSSGEHRWHGYYRSTDGGSTWSSSLLPGFPGDTSPQGLASPLHASNATSDPVLSFDRMGNVYYTGLVFNITNYIPNGGGSIANNTAFVAKYANDGATYSGITLIQGWQFDDKPWVAVDTSGGPSDGNVYLAFDASLTSTSAFGTVFTRSTDGGLTFAPPFFAPSDQTGEFPGITVDPSGNVYVSTIAYDPITGVDLNYTQVTKITNGGTTIAQNVKVINPSHELPSTLPGGSFRTFTIPQIASDGRGVYLVYDDYSRGNANVFLTRSTDGGLTWTLPLRINDHPEFPGQHFFPTIAVSGGIINVAWYDSRVGGGSLVTPLDVFYASSMDEGVSFSANTRVTSVSFDPNLVKRTDLFPDIAPFMGDYIGIAATPFNAYPLWADNRFACDTFDSVYNSCVDQDAFTAQISLPDYTISTNPPTQTIKQGASGATNITLASLNGFQGNVNVISSSSPTGLPMSPAAKIVTIPAAGTGSFNLTFTPTSSTPPTTYTISIASSSGPRTHPTQITVTVNPSQSVGGAIIPLDKVGLLLQFLPAAILLSAVLTAGIVAVKVRSRRKREGPAYSEIA